MKEEIIILIFLLLGPILDVTVYYNLPINIIARGLYLAGIIGIMLFRKRNLKLLIPLLIFSMIEFIYQLSYLDFSISSSISNTLKFLYLPASILYFKDFEFKKYDKRRVLSIILFTYIGIYLFSYITKIGSNAYKDIEKKIGYRGLFNSINEFSAIIIGILPLVVDYFDSKKKYLLIFLTIFSVGVCSLLLGTKVLLLGIIIIVLFYLFKERQKVFFERSKLEKILMITFSIILVITAILLFTKTNVYKNMKIQQDFFKVDNIFSYNYLNKVIFNDRLSFIGTNFDYFRTCNIIKIILGIGLSNPIVKLVEIDIFDILFRYGIIGFILFTFIISKSKFNKFNSYEKLSFILLILISLTSGHVLLYPNVCIYIGLLNSKNIE